MYLSSLVCFKKQVLAKFYYFHLTQLVKYTAKCHWHPTQVVGERDMSSIPGNILCDCSSAWRYIVSCR